MPQRKETKAEQKLPPHFKGYNDLVDRLDEVRPRAEAVLEEYNAIVRGLEAISPIGLFKETADLPPALK